MAYFFPCSTHAFSLTQAIDLARILDRLPAEFLIFGIEGERFKLGCQISPRVIAAVDEVATRICYLVRTQVLITRGGHKFLQYRLTPESIAAA